MKLLRKAVNHRVSIDPYLDTIRRIEAQFRCELKISALMIHDFPQDGQETLGWLVEPEDREIVCVYPTFNWGPGAGPRVTLKECLDSLTLALDQCIRIEKGKPGLTGPSNQRHATNEVHP